MGILWLAALAIGPGLSLTHIVWARDREREPLGNLLVYLLLGAVSVIPAVLLGIPATLLLHPGDASESATALARLLLLPAWVLLGVALVEEFSKRLLLGARARNDRHIDEPFDWLVYAVAVALGFATVENILYVFQHGTGVGLMRAFTAVPAHALNGTMMGWRLGRAARLGGAEARRERWLALLEPTVWHAAYDLPLFALEGAGSTGARVLLLLAWGTVLVVQWRICVRRIIGLMRAQRHATPPILALDELARRLSQRARAW